MSTGNYRVVPLDTKLHDRAAFRSGSSSLDRYIQRQAGQDMRARVNSVFVMTPLDEPSVIAGFYTLCGVGLDPGDVPREAKKRLPRYPQISATLLGQLAVETSYQGQGLGRVLLFDALARAYQATVAVGSVMVVTDPLGDEAAAFYRKYGFGELTGTDREPPRMFLMMKTIGRLVDTA